MIYLLIGALFTVIFLTSAVVAFIWGIRED